MFGRLPGQRGHGTDLIVTERRLFDFDGRNVNGLDPFRKIRVAMMRPAFVRNT